MNALSERNVACVTANSERNVACVTANSERRQQVGISALYGSISDLKNTSRELNSTDDSHGYNPDEIIEFPVSEEPFDRHRHTSHCCFRIVKNSFLA